ncbi:MAG TPA: NAD-dependent epimerase/dehydratase family protein [Streptosporangiaceae bacterium]|nr:NAD-dependent epimerase/dehydratase family protein [Streptosporangiaceae bacterium]
MRILIIGGTAFVGRHIAQAAADRGHDLTLFHRGKTGADLFPQATHLSGDRDEDLSALSAGNWDATIDVCAYFPRQVRSLAAALSGRGGRYVYISSVSAYSPSVPPGFDESAPLADIDDADATEITDANYGGLEVACEQAGTELFGPEVTIIRPTFVIGPHDRSGRFNWWVDRIARGGTVLAPGDPTDPIQLIDGRDQGNWIVSLLERSVTGTFNSVGPVPPFGFGDMLAAIAAEVAPAGTRLTWVDSDFLCRAGVDGAALPLWGEGDAGAANMMTANPAAAFAAGLRVRPLRQTVADIRAEARAPGSGRPGVGISADREAELLARWAERAKPQQ